MKFLSSTLTVLLKFIFFTIFLSGIFILSILYTYLNQNYYENYFAEGLINIQSENISEILTQNSDNLPFELSEQQVDEALNKVFTKEIIEKTFEKIFSTIKNYDGKILIIDLQDLKKQEDQLIGELVKISMESIDSCDEIGETDIAISKLCPPKGISKSNIEKKANAFLSENVNFLIPPVIEISTENSIANNFLKKLQFIITYKTIITLLIIILMFLPLLGIFALNIHPFYKGIQKVSTSLMLTGAVTTIFQLYMILESKLLNSSQSIKPILKKVNITPTDNNIKDILDFIFSRMFHIVTLTGLIMLGIGIILYFSSRFIKRKYEYS